MTQLRITNCHIHTFTTAHAPRYFPSWPVVVFRLVPWLLQLLRWASRFVSRDLHDKLIRLENFHRTGSRQSQMAVFREILPHYPSSARFVVLPIDMALIGHGPVDDDIYAQHDELAAMRDDPDVGSRIIPFATVYPDRLSGRTAREKSAFEEFRRCVECLGFRGLKLYPRLGFAPDHDVLMEEVYPYCLERNLPVMAHCSRGGVRGKSVTQAQADSWTSPEAFIPVMERFPELRICLAHFGGDQDWTQLLRDGVDPFDPQARKKNWVLLIADMIRSGGWPGLWTDISYTIFKFSDYIPLLRLYLEDDRLRERVLFGSDFYMTRQEKLSEKAISIRLRDALGEDIFRQIAMENAERWLGEETSAGRHALLDPGERSAK